MHLKTLSTTQNVCIWDQEINTLNLKGVLLTFDCSYFTIFCNSPIACHFRSDEAKIFYLWATTRLAI